MKISEELMGAPGSTTLVKVNAPVEEGMLTEFQCKGEILLN